MIIHPTIVMMALAATLSIGIITYSIGWYRICLIPLALVILTMPVICIPRFGFILNSPDLYRYEGDLYTRSGEAVLWGYFRIPHANVYDGWAFMIMESIFCGVGAIWIITKANVARQAEKLAA